MTEARQAAHLGEALLSAQLLQLGLLLSRVEEDHKLASRSPAGVPAVTQCHHSVQAVEPAALFLFKLDTILGLEDQLSLTAFAA